MLGGLSAIEKIHALSMIVLGTIHPTFGSGDVNLHP
jgi:hypothetical protein